MSLFLFQRLTVKSILFVILISLLGLAANAQGSTYRLESQVNVSPDVNKLFTNNGRLYLFLSTNPQVEPRTQTWPSPWGGTAIFAKNIEAFDIDNGITILDDQSWNSTVEWSLNDIPEGDYYVQVLWDQDQSESRIDAHGNLYTLKQKVTLTESKSINLELDQVIEERQITKHLLVREVDFRSDLLSKWWSKDVTLKASILLPHKYSKGQAYPIRYNVAGYGGRYTRINRLINDKDFMGWWDSEASPQVITVFLDGEGPFGDSYQMDSDNSGPYGSALIKEFIPYVENEFRGTSIAETRFVDGCSTGGWVSLGLQLYYPESFNGVFSYSPDAVEFENYQLINHYEDKNAYTNEFGYPRPVMRDTKGEPMLTMKQFITYENVLGSSDSYLDSGGQFSAHNALYSPKGKNGLPEAIFDPLTGDINQEVAEYWKKYDFKIYAEKNWDTLGPKLQGKIFIWMGDMDHFYLNPATRSFDQFLQSTENPKSDANIVFTPMSGHCSEYSHKEVLLKIEERLLTINNISKGSGN